MSSPKSTAEIERDIAIAVGPGPRPKDPREISFDPRCFAEVGQRVEYVVSPAPGSTSYPKHFTDRAAADTWARRTRQPVREVSVPVMKRIRWK